MDRKSISHSVIRMSLSLSRGVLMNRNHLDPGTVFDFIQSFGSMNLSCHHVTPFKEYIGTMMESFVTLQFFLIYSLLSFLLSMYSRTLVIPWFIMSVKRLIIQFFLQVLFSFSFPGFFSDLGVVFFWLVEVAFHIYLVWLLVVVIGGWPFIWKLHRILRPLDVLYSDLYTSLDTLFVLAWFLLVMI